MSDDLVKREYLIHKSGRGWYRENSQGYTSFKYDAGRYTEAEAKTISHPNGEDGPRDGMLYRHESMVRDAPSDRIEELTAKLAEVEDNADYWHEESRWQYHRAEAAEAKLKEVEAEHTRYLRTMEAKLFLAEERAEAAEARERDAYQRGFKAALGEAAKACEEIRRRQITRPMPGRANFDQEQAIREIPMPGHGAPWAQQWIEDEVKKGSET